MLKDMRKKYGEHYSSILKQTFSNAKEVQCNWGVPVIEVILTFEDQDITTLGFQINVETEQYSLNVETYKLEDEIKVSKPTSLDGKVISFIVDTVIKITENMFSAPEDTDANANTEETESVEVEAEEA